VNTASQEGHSRANTATSSLLGNVPADAVNIFSSSPPSGPVRQESTRPSAPGSVQSRRTSQSSDPPLSPRRKVRLAKPEPIHKRNQTMEQTLAGLTVALAGKNRATGQGLDSFSDTSHQSRPEAPKPGASSGETLAKNVDILFGGQKLPGGGDTGGGSPKKAAANWRKLRNVVNVTSTIAAESRSDHQTAAAINPPSHHSIPDSVNIGMMDSLAASESNMEEIGEKAEEDVEAGDHPQVNVQGGTGGAGGVGDDHNESRIHGKKIRRFGRSSKNAVVQSGFIRDFTIFVGQRRSSFLSYLRFLLVVVFPAMAVAFILFYAAGKCSAHPNTG